jgi:catalase
LKRRPEAKPLRISGDALCYDHREGNDDYTQTGKLFRLMGAEEQQRLI